MSLGDRGSCCVIVLVMMHWRLWYLMFWVSEIRMLAVLFAESIRKKVCLYSMWRHKFMIQWVPKNWRIEKVVESIRLVPTQFIIFFVLSFLMGVQKNWFSLVCILCKLDWDERCSWKYGVWNISRVVDLYDAKAQKHRSSLVDYGFVQHTCKGKHR